MNKDKDKLISHSKKNDDKVELNVADRTVLDINYSHELGLDAVNVITPNSGTVVKGTDTRTSGLDGTFVW